MFARGKPFQPSLLFASKAKAYTSPNHLKGAPLYGRLLALPTNIRLDWKGLTGTNTIAYYRHM